MKTIGVAGVLPPGIQTTFDALGRALGVSFRRRAFQDDDSVDGWIVLAADRKAVSEVGCATRPCYVVPHETELTSCGSSSSITFANRPELTPVLRGRQITADDAIPAKTLPHWLENAVPFGFKDGSAVWAVRDYGQCRHHYVSLPLPGLKRDEALFTLFSGQRLVSLLPLVLFVKSLAEDPSWKPPPLQATFMFDDPNLHWPSYGFIDYREMVRRAVAGMYHASIATIPLDAWFVHRPTGVIFKEHPRQLSLLYHGNDHVFRELGRSQPGQTMRRTLRQAVGRISRLEASAGLEVARVMAAPHGACGETALSEMARLGFEAACVSRGSLRRHNDGAAWLTTIGMKPCDIVAGLSVIPRFGLTKSCTNEVIVAALLRQPIVAVAHHDAVAEGYDLLDETASFVNSLGEVTWQDMKSIVRSLYSQKQENETLIVRMASKRVNVVVPAATRAVRVERPWLDDSASEALFWRNARKGRQWSIESDLEVVAVEAGDTLDIASGPTRALPVESHHAGRHRLIPVARRVLTETRDRALPVIRRMAQHRRRFA
jgi:hypothetical protein